MPARLEAFDEMPFLAEALDRTGHDRVFEAAVDRAVKLTAALVPGAASAAGPARRGMNEDALPGQPRHPRSPPGPKRWPGPPRTSWSRWSPAAIGARGIAHVALTGGSSAAGLYRELRTPARRLSLDWSRVHLWFGDDRVVPLDHPDSERRAGHRRAAGATTVRSSPLRTCIRCWQASTRRPPMPRSWRPGCTPRPWRQMVPTAEGVPAFDLLLLGMGPDGHVLSVFPDSQALLAGAPIVMPIPAPTHIGPAWPRVTLGPAVIGAAGGVLLMAAGGAKAPTVVDVLGPVWDPMRLPAQLARIDSATWLLDPDSSALLVRG